MNENQDDPPAGNMGFLEHLEELRVTLMKCLAVFVLSIVGISFFLTDITHLLLQPMADMDEWTHGKILQYPNTGYLTLHPLHLLSQALDLVEALALSRAVGRLPGSSQAGSLMSALIPDLGLVISATK